MTGHSVWDSGPMAAPALRWGILGAGRIAGVFTHCVTAATAGEVAAIASRDADRADRFAVAHGIPTSCGSYAALVADPGIDAVYVATPHSEHAAHALLAIAAGKPVLVEKAFAGSLAETVEVLAAASEAGVPVLEALWTRYLPQVDAIRAALAAGEIGRVVHMHCAIGLVAPGDPRHRLNDPELAGGVLLDMGVYAVSLADALFGTPTLVAAAGRTAATGVDSHASLVLHHEGSVQVSITASMEARPPTEAVITGTEGVIRVHDRFYGRTAFDVTTSSGTRRTWTPRPGLDDAKGMEHEAAAMAWTIAERALEHPAVPWRSTRDVMRVLDEARSRILHGPRGDRDRSDPVG